MYLDEILRETAARTPQRTAVEVAGKNISYQALDALVSRVASGFLNLGLESGDRLAYQVRNCRVEAMVTLLAGLRAGLVVVPITVRQPPAQTAYVLRHCAARAFVTENELFQALCPEQRAGPEWIIGTGSAADGAIAFDALPGEPARSSARASSDEEAVGLIVYTSGTTSHPKAVAHSEHRLRRRVEMFVREMGLTEDDATVIAHDIGRPAVLVGQVLAMFQVGGRISLVDADDPEAFWAAYWQQGETSYLFTIAGVGTSLLSHPAASRSSHASLRFWIFGADRVLPRAHQLAQEVLRRPILEMLGLTEVGMIAVTPRHGEIRPGSVGKVMPGCEVRITDESGAEVPVGEAGELFVRSPTMMLGYWNDPAATAQAFTGEWLRTGDLGRFDADGYLWIVGRIKLLISRGGVKVAPPMVEDALRAHPAIRAAVVVAQPHPTQNQVPFAFYLVRADAAEPGAAELRQWLQPKLDRPSIPDGFVRLEAFPVTPQGKIDRARLTKMAESLLPGATLKTW